MSRLDLLNRIKSEIASTGYALVSAREYLTVMSGYAGFSCEMTDLGQDDYANIRITL